jgi:hypothetical protein
MLTTNNKITSCFGVYFRKRYVEIILQETIFLSGPNHKVKIQKLLTGQIYSFINMYLFIYSLDSYLNLTKSFN